MVQLRFNCQPVYLAAVLLPHWRLAVDKL